MTSRRKTEGDLLRMLRRRYSAPQWALFGGVRNTTGYSRGTARTADAVAIGLWPSRGLSIHGFEVKCQRSDWLRELAQNKSEEIQKYCDYWWIVAADKTLVDVDTGELPKTWGLLVPRKGGVLVTVVEAPQLKPKPLDRGFIAAICRRAHEDAQPSNELTHQLRQEIREELESKKKGCGHEYELSMLKSNLERAERDLKDYRDAEREAGLPIAQWQLKGRAQTVKLLTNGGTDHLVTQLERVQTLIDEVGVMTTETLAELAQSRKDGGA